jgi:hypothetical protein
MGPQCLRRDRRQRVATGDPAPIGSTRGARLRHTKRLGLQQQLVHLCGRAYRVRWALLRNARPAHATAGRGAPHRRQRARRHAQRCVAGHRAAARSVVARGVWISLRERAGDRVAQSVGLCAGGPRRECAAREADLDAAGAGAQRLVRGVRARRAGCLLSRSVRRRVSAVASCPSLRSTRVAVDHGGALRNECRPRAAVHGVRH